MITYFLVLFNLLFFVLLLISLSKIQSERKEEKSLKKQLELVNEKLKDIDKDKKEFIDVITHELNTPLATISGYLSIILELPEGEVRASVLNLVKKSFEGTKRMSKIIEDLIASSQSIGRSGMQSIQLEEIISKMIEDFSEEAHERNLYLSFKPPKIMPAPLVKADPLSVKIALANLIDNALKFTKQGGVTVEEDIQKDCAVVKVKDTGIGIKKEDQKRIFDKFFQVDSSHTREAGGTGVGLYIVKNLIEKQDGKIWLESELGKGTIFCFSLPI